MAISELVRRRMKEYADRWAASGTDHDLTDLILAAQKFGKMAKIYTITGCQACRDRRIAGSSILVALDRGRDIARIVKALEQFHQISEPETMLDLVVRYASTIGDTTAARAAILQLGRWMHLPVVRHRVAALSLHARSFDVRLVAAQVLWANDLEHPLDEAVAMSPLIRRYLPTTKPGTNYQYWVQELPVRRRRIEGRQTAESLRQRLCSDTQPAAQ